MTEEEARKKWCPMARVENINGNRAQTVANIDESRCIASDCMLWRWKRTPQEAALQSGLSQKFHCTAVGYCGLGGKP